MKASSGGGTPAYDVTDNKLLKTYYDEFAEYLVAAVTMFKEEAGIDIYAIGLQNEPAFCEPYPSAILDPVHFAEQIVDVAKRFEKEGIKTKLYMPEQVFPQNHYSMKDYMDAIQANPEADKYCDIIAVHGYAADGIGQGQPDFSAWNDMYNYAQQGQYPKELWMTETYTEYRLHSMMQCRWQLLFMADWFTGITTSGHSGVSTDRKLNRADPRRCFMLRLTLPALLNPVLTGSRLQQRNPVCLTSAFVDEAEWQIDHRSHQPGSDAISADFTGANLPTQFESYRTSLYEELKDLGTVGDQVILPGRTVTTLVAEGNKTPTIDQPNDMLLR